MARILRAIIRGFLYWSGIWLVIRFRNHRKIVILMYHGVTDKPIINWTQVPAGRFEKQMRYLNRRYNPMRLRETVSILNGRQEACDYAAVITFDDGFKNNYTCAYPIMKHFEIPSTIFVTTSFIDKNPRFGGLLWTDYISSILSSTKVERLDLTEFGLGVIDLTDEIKRYEAKGYICYELKKMDTDAKNRIIEEIGRKLRSEVSEYDYSIFQSMDWENIAELSKDGSVEIGAHSVNHEILPNLPPGTMEREILDSKEIIERRTGGRVSSFAYPNGSYDERVKSKVSENFECALTSQEGLNRVGDDVYRLKRFNIYNDMKLWEFKLAIAGVPEFLGRLAGPLKVRDEAY
jgi:peptidoglycan/xylan/chitin deacetylase (PgdA/CDA1 family)